MALDGSGPRTEQCLPDARVELNVTCVDVEALA